MTDQSRAAIDFERRLTERLDRRDATIEALRERVAELEDERDRWAKLAGRSFHDEHSALGKAYVAAAAAEARLAELEKLIGEVPS